MNIGWIFASQYRLDPAVDVDAVKNLGPTWGSWKTWRSCGTDNVICHERGKAQELLDRSFHNSCNFYIPKEFYQSLNRPQGVNLYDGDYRSELDDIEDIVAMHLASATNDIVLLVGFDLSKPAPIQDRFERHKVENRLGLIRGIINKDPARQWVLVDHPNPMDLAFQSLPNITCDEMSNVLKLAL